MKLVLITGSSRGIGAETARLFAENDYYVALNYNKSQGAASKIAESTPNCQPFRADVSVAEQVEKMFSEIYAAFGKAPDVLINNVGISCEGLFTDTTLDDYERVFNVNVKSMYLCTKAALKSMVSKKRGKIINISSMWGQTGASCEVLYSASKAAVIGFTKALAKEVGPSGINVNCIAPGVIKTDMLSCYSDKDLDDLAQETPLSRLGSPRDIANAALFLAKSDSDFITGQVLGVNGGFYI